MEADPHVAAPPQLRAGPRRGSTYPPRDVRRRGIRERGARSRAVARGVGLRLAGLLAAGYPLRPPRAAAIARVHRRGDRRDRARHRPEYDAFYRVQRLCAAAVRRARSLLALRLHLVWQDRQRSSSLATGVSSPARAADRVLGRPGVRQSRGRRRRAQRLRAAGDGELLRDAGARDGDRKAAASGRPLRYGPELRRLAKQVRRGPGDDRAQNLYARPAVRGRGDREPAVRRPRELSHLRSGSP